MEVKTVCLFSCGGEFRESCLFTEHSSSEDEFETICGTILSIALLLGACPTECDCFVLLFVDGLLSHSESLG